MSETPDHALPQFFEPQPLALIQYLAVRIDRQDWEAYVDAYVNGATCNEQAGEELRQLLSPEMSAFPDMSVDAYDAVCALGHHYACGYAPTRTNRAILEAFALALAIQAETRGMVVADAADVQLARLIELGDDVGLECLRLCGGFISWIRMHIQSHTWASSGMIAATAVLMLSAAKLAAEAVAKLETEHWEPSEAEEASCWSRLLDRAERALQASSQGISRRLDKSRQEHRQP